MSIRRPSPVCPPLTCWRSAAASGSAVRHRILTRRFWPAFVLVATALLSGPPASAQPDLADEDPQRRQIVQEIDTIQSLLQDRNWLQATDTFDTVWSRIYQGEDPLLTMNTAPGQQLRPGQHENQAGARARLEELWTSAPEAFRSQYRKQFEPIASEQIAASYRSSDPTAVRRQLIRFQFTDTARQAARTLITLHASRGEFLEAALQTGQLLRLTADPQQRMQQQLDLVVLWWLSGLQEEAVDVLRNLLRTPAADTLLLAGKEVSAPAAGTDLRQWLSDQLGPKSQPQTVDWQQPLGNYRRTQDHTSGPPDLNAVWSASTFHCEINEQLNPLLQIAADYVDSITLRNLAEGNAVASTAAPIVFGDLIVYRAVTNLQARNRLTGDLVWETGNVDRQLTTIVNRFRDDASDADRQLLQRAMLISPQLFNHWTRANVGGQMTTDGQFVYAVEEVTATTMPLDPDNLRNPRQNQAVNYLRVYELATGKLRGQAGGFLDGSGGGPVNPLAGMYFLGAPLVMGQRIYVLAENDQGIFLLQLQVRQPQGQPAGPLTGELDLRPVHSQLLSVPRFELEQHPVRQYSGVIPSFAQGLLICSACDERVVAISAEDHSVRWIYRYYGNVTVPELGSGFPVVGNAINQRSSMLADQSSRWQDALPRIAADRVLLTPRDSDRLICLDLQSGQELWTRPRGAMRSIAAVTQDLVVLVGATSVEGLSLEDGRVQWRTELDGDPVCGQAAVNDRILQLPTSAPAIETIDLTNGRRLFRQALPQGQLPGNLLGLEGDLYSQSLQQVRRLAADPEQDSAPLLAVHQRLLQGDVQAATELMNSILDNQSDTISEPEREAARQLLITTLLESLRLDYAGSADQIPRLRQLITDSAPPTDQVATLVRSMLGMTPLDAAILPAQLQQIDRTRRQLESLQDTATQGLLDQLDLPAEALAEHILRQLDSVYAAGNREVSAGPVICRADRRAAAAIRMVLETGSAASEPRSEAQRQQLLRTLSEPLQQRLQNSASPEEVLWWCRICQQSGLLPAVAETIAAAPEFPERLSLLVQSQLLGELVSQPQSELAAASLLQLLQLWQQHGMTASLRELLSDLPDSADSAAENTAVDARPSDTASPLRQLSLPADSGVLSAAEAWRQQHAELLSRPADVWQGTPTVSESAARSVQAQQDPRIGAAGQNVPLYGFAGAFTGWVFVQPVAANSLEAYDSYGKLRWQFDPGVMFPDQGNRFSRLYNRVSERYVLACGHLLAVKLQHMLFMLDCSTATAETPPTVLWERNLSTTLEEPTPTQQFNRAWQRTEQYDIQPAGLFPAGPLTVNGLPLYSGQQLQVVDPLTGERQWQVGGLAGDCTLTGTDRELCLISENTGQVEVRDLLDGSVLRRFAVPDWWTDANENSNSPVTSFEIEPGSDTYWRLTVAGGRCLLFRLTTQEASLESFSLAKNAVVWKISLPPDSVFSNVANGLVAVLSQTDQLRLIDANSGTVVAELKVPAAQNCQGLYLRPGHDRLLVLTDCLEDPPADLNPIINSKPVHGRVYGIDATQMSLAWTAEIDQESIRVLNPEQPPTIPVAPLLILLKRPTDTGRDTLTTHYSARILDTRTGAQLYSEEDLGRTLNFHALRLDEADREIQVGFEQRTVTFSYPDPENPAKSPASR